MIDYYIAGPMRGLALWNFPAFREACAYVRSLGLTVVSPHELDEAIGFTENTVDLPDGFMAGALRRDVEALLEVEEILLLPGWKRSTGAQFELSVARSIGLKVATYDPVRSCRIIRRDWTWIDEAIDETAAQVAIDEREHDVVPLADFLAADDPWHEVDAEDQLERLEGERSEVRHTSASGGQKGRKLARFNMIPPDVMHDLAEHYGKGEAKYPGDPDTGQANWQKGYPWSWSVDSLERHLNAWKRGEDFDEDGNLNLIAVIWHAIDLRWQQSHGTGVDDIYSRQTEVSA